MIFIFFTDVGIEPTLPLHCISTSIVMPFFALDFGEPLYASLHLFFLSFCFVQELVVFYIFLCNFVNIIIFFSFNLCGEEQQCCPKFFTIFS
jgi:hypothetical protein